MFFPFTWKAVKNQVVFLWQPKPAQNRSIPAVASRGVALIFKIDRKRKMVSPHEGLCGDTPPEVNYFATLKSSFAPMPNPVVRCAYQCLINRKSP
jgi:hypothetical protein